MLYATVTLFDGCAHCKSDGGPGVTAAVIRNLGTIDERSDSRPGRFTPGERASDTHWGSVCPKASLDISERYILAPATNRTVIPSLSTQRPSHFTHWATPAIATLPNVHPFNSRALYKMVYYTACSDGELWIASSNNVEKAIVTRFQGNTPASASTGSQINLWGQSGSESGTLSIQAEVVTTARQPIVTSGAKTSSNT
jgi:hypothetical protein